jgi:hypothetical protein
MYLEEVRNHLVSLDPISALINGGLGLMNLLLGNISANSLLDIGIGAVFLIALVKYWYAINIIAFVLLFWKTNQIVLKVYKKTWNFILKFILPLMIPVTSGFAEGLAGFPLKKETKITYEIIHKNKPP